MSDPRGFLSTLLLGLGVGGPVVGCAGDEAGEEAEELAPRHEVVGNVDVVRSGFRLSHPESWRIDTADPASDPDHYLLLLGPGDASVVLMLLDQPADPAALVGGMVADHGLSRVEQVGFSRWGRYRGFGLDLRGRDPQGKRGGMRVFAWSSGARSFLMAESYRDAFYAFARPGFRRIETTFRLLDEGTAWPAVALGTSSGREGELAIHRPGLRLTFPDTWSVDASEEGYDPDTSFRLVSPVGSSWVRFRILAGSADVADVVSDSRQALGALFDRITGEDGFQRWGRFAGSGLELRGLRNGLDSGLRLFCHSDGQRVLIVTEFWFEEVRPKVEAGFRLIASSFELLEGDGARNPEHER